MAYDMATATTQKSQHAYTQELVVLAIVAVVAGLATTVLSIIAKGHAEPLGALAFGALAGLGANLLDPRTTRSILRLILGIAAGAMMALTMATSPLLAAVLGGGLIGAAFSLEYGTSPVQRGLLWLAYAGALGAGTYTASTLLDIGFLEGLSQIPAGTDIARAGIWSVFLMLPTGFKYVQWEDDPILAEFTVALSDLHGRHHQLLETGLDAYRRIQEEMKREANEAVRDRAQSVAAEVSRGLIGLTKRADELSSTVERTMSRSLDIRARELESRIRSTRDAALKRELVAALSEVVEQMRARRRLETAVARLEARQQRYLTALDRLHVTLVQNDSLATASGSLGVSLDELSRLTEEVHWQNLSVEELCDSSFDDLDPLPEDEDEVDESELDDLLDEVYALSDVPATKEGLPRPHLPPVRGGGRSMDDEEVVLSETDGDVGGCADEGVNATTEAEPSPHEDETADVPEHEHAEVPHSR